jgi:hypothetical protein
MVISGPPLGFSFTSLVKSVGHDVASVARNPAVQQAAVAAGQAYAPGTYNQATYWADRARGVIAPPGTVNVPAGPPPPSAPGPAGGDDDAAPVGPQHVEKNKMLPWLIIGGGGILLLLMLKR